MTPDEEDNLKKMCGQLTKSERIKIQAALAEWLKNQDIPPAVGAWVMIEFGAANLGACCCSWEHLYKGVEYAHEMVATIASQVFEKAHDS